MHDAEGGEELRESSAPTEDTYRAHFAAWLGGMSDEVRQLAFLLEREEASAPLRRLAADSLNQLLHAADLLPEGTEALGYLETCFAFRLLAAEQSEAAFSAPRLPKPRPRKVEPAMVQPLEPEAAEPLPGEVSAESSASPLAEGVEAEGAEAEPGVVAAGAEETWARAAERSEAAEVDVSEAEAAEGIAAESVGADGERIAVPLPAAPEAAEESPAAAEAAPEESAAEAVQAVAAEREAAETVAADFEAVAAEAAQLEEEPEEEPERAQASDESYAVVRRLAPQAALVRAFLGADDAERLRRLVLEQRSRSSRGRSSKEILLESEARAAAASDARDWAELYEAPEFGSTQHDLLKLRTFMRTRVRRGAS